MMLRWKITKPTELLYSYRVQALRKFLILSAAIGILFTLFFSAADAPQSTTAGVLFSLTVIVGVWLFRKKYYRTAAVLITFSMLVATFWVVIFSGGFHSALLIWLACPPLIVGFLVNWRWSIAYGTAIALFCLGLQVFLHHPEQMSEFAVHHKQGMSHALSIFSVISAVCTILFFSVENHKALALLVHEATQREQTDGLTGVLNRSGFNKIIQNLENHSSDVGGAMILFDVDNFKHINDSYGHPFGDTVLMQITNTIAETLRADDYFARIGGDEFAIILPRATQTQAKEVGERLRTAVGEICLATHSGQPVQVQISIGVAICDDAHLFKPEPMLHLADAALYEAKKLSSGISVAALEHSQFANMPDAV